MNKLAVLVAATAVVLPITVVTSNATAAPATTGSAPAFGKYGPLSGAAGKGSFRFGVATSATQIEDKNQNTDWYAWTQPPPEGLGKSPAVGEGVGGSTTTRSTRCSARASSQ